MAALGSIGVDGGGGGVQAAAPDSGSGIAATTIVATSGVKIASGIGNQATTVTRFARARTEQRTTRRRFRGFSWN